MLARLIDNDLLSVAGKPSIVINDGLLGNMVCLEEPAQAHERIARVMPFHL